MRPDDDSDMKIVSEQPVPEAADGTADLLKQERMNGNLSKARRLGACMADRVASAEDDQAAHSVKTVQRRILMAFAVEVGLDAFLPNNLTAQTAQGVFYDTLQITSPHLYEDLQSTGAFSFYYLCLRAGTGVEQQVGETFATLCGQSGDSRIAADGQALYIRFMAQIKQLTDAFAFVS